MPKDLKRYYGQDHLHYLTCSCYHRQPWLATPRRRDLFSQILEETRRRYGFVVVGYVVMPDHIHLLISEPERGTPSTVMQVVKQRYARSVLRREKRGSGQCELCPDSEEHVWQRRFYDFNVWSARKADRETALYASQSCEAGIGAGSGAMGVEQFSQLRLSGGRASGRQSVA
jgi:putative transposase